MMKYLLPECVVVYVRTAAVTGENKPTSDNIIIIVTSASSGFLVHACYGFIRANLFVLALM